MEKLKREFFAQNVVEVAEKLIGKQLIFGDHKFIITETEAYRGMDDEASHAYRHTPRSSIMFGAPGFSYVYMIYGIYYCLNIVAEPAGDPAGVLIRGLTNSNNNLSGPGKICKFWGITKAHNAIDLVTSNNFYIAASDWSGSFKTAPRIGVTKAREKLWRFYAELESEAKKKLQ